MIKLSFSTVWLLSVI